MTTETTETAIRKFESNILLEHVVTNIYGKESAADAVVDEAWRIARDNIGHHLFDELDANDQVAGTHEIRDGRLFGLCFIFAGDVPIK